MLTTISQACKVTERLNSGQKEIGTTPDRGKGWESLDLLSNGALWDRHVKRAVLCAEYGITLVSQFMKVWVVGPHIHREFQLPDKTRTPNKGRNSPFYPVLGSTLW